MDREIFSPILGIKEDHKKIQSNQFYLQNNFSNNSQIRQYENKILKYNQEFVLSTQKNIELESKIATYEMIISQEHACLSGLIIELSSRKYFNKHLTNQFTLFKCKLIQTNFERKDLLNQVEALMIEIEQHEYNLSKSIFEKDTIYKKGSCLIDQISQLHDNLVKEQNENKRLVRENDSMKESVQNLMNDLNISQKQTGKLINEKAELEKHLRDEIKAVNKDREKFQAQILKIQESFCQQEQLKIEQNFNKKEKKSENKNQLNQIYEEIVKLLPSNNIQIEKKDIKQFDILKLVQELVESVNVNEDKIKELLKNIKEKEMIILQNSDEITHLKQESNETHLELEKAQIQLTKYIKKYINNDIKIPDQQLKELYEELKIDEFESQSLFLNESQDIPNLKEGSQCKLNESINTINIIEHNKVSVLANYDEIINIKSLDQLIQNNGWSLYKKSNFSMINQNNCVVGLFGAHNSGKTWLISQLSDINLPHGNNHYTKGISLLNDNKNGIVYLDTKPYPDYIKNTSKEHSILDQSNLNMFLWRYITNSANILLLVINDELTLIDRTLVNRIKFEIYNEKDKKLFIVHNYQNLCKIKDVENKIEKDIIESFQIQELKYAHLQPDSPFDSKCFIDEENNQVIHVVLAKEHSEAGESFNPILKSILMNSIIEVYMHNSISKPFSLEQSMTIFLENELSRYYRWSSASPNNIKISIEKISENSIITKSHEEMIYQKSHIKLDTEDLKIECMIKDTHLSDTENIDASVLMESKEYFIWEIKTNGEISLEELESADLTYTKEENEFYFILNVNSNENMKPDLIFKTPRISPWTKILELGDIINNTSRELKDGNVILKWKKINPEESD